MQLTARHLSLLADLMADYSPTSRAAYASDSRNVAVAAAVAWNDLQTVQTWLDQVRACQLERLDLGAQDVHRLETALLFLGTKAFYMQHAASVSEVEELLEQLVE